MRSLFVFPKNNKGLKHKMKVNNKRKIFDETIKLKDNALLKNRPDLFNEWCFEKNDEIGLDIYKITKGSEKTAYWKCSKCTSEYEMIINIRFYNKKCPYCSNRKVNYTNSVASIRPDLAKQWHPILNGELTPHDVAIGSSTQVWWQCDKGHEWSARASDRNKYESRCCTICVNKKVLKGYNDLFTTHPETASLLLNKEDGIKYTYGSKQRVNWKCLTCDEIIMDKSIDKVVSTGLSCPNCTSTSMRYPERLMYHFLKETNIEFIRQKSFEWSENKVYDFFIPSFSSIIETHGEQHYNGGFSSYGGRTLEEEQENDMHKQNLATTHGIDNYLVIDCRTSNFEYIKNNIINSKLSDLIDLNLVDWHKINLNSQASMNVDILNYWNAGLSLKEIIEETKISRNTVSKILQNYHRLGKCVYDVNRGRKKNLDKKSKRKIYQLDSNLKPVKTWEGLDSIQTELGYSKHSIRGCCAGRSVTSHGFIWRYEEDLDEGLIS